MNDLFLKTAIFTLSLLLPMPGHIFSFYNLQNA